MTTIIERHGVIDPQQLVGTFRRFGDVGPVYEVLALADHDTAIIRVVESGEELEYPIEQVADDVEA